MDTEYSVHHSNLLRAVQSEVRREAEFCLAKGTENVNSSCYCSEYHDANGN